jgi:glycosyltransferase involved in cell wall biosynthesis
MQEYDLGTHPLFMLAKSARRIFLEKPYLFCGIMRLSGFLYLSLRRTKRSISDDALKYVRSEQIGRIGSFVQRLFRLKLASEAGVTSVPAAEILSPTDKDFILISPVYNEEVFMDQLIQSVVSQTIRPKKWIIVDDGSTDGTQAIAKKYGQQYDFIMYHYIERRNKESYYYSKTKAFQAGYDSIKHLDYSFVACLDADLTLSPTYYEDVLREFKRNPKLGIASGIYVNNIDGRLRKVVRDSSGTPGGLQIFRRECYESFGGYTPLRYGGEDALANVMARMHGWQTQSFSEYRTIHHRLIGVRGGTSALRGKLIQGLAEYHLWTHPVFMLAKSLRRAFIERPYIFASAARLLGFIQGYLRREKRNIPDEIKYHVRKEQIRRLFWRVT